MSFRHFTRISSVLLCRFNLKQLLTSKAFAIQSNHEKRDFWRKCEPLSFRSARVLAVCQSILVENELFWFIFLGHLCLVIIVWIFYKFLQFFELFWIFLDILKIFGTFFCVNFLPEANTRRLFGKRGWRNWVRFWVFFCMKFSENPKWKWLRRSPTRRSPWLNVNQWPKVAWLWFRIVCHLCWRRMRKVVLWNVMRGRILRWFQICSFKKCSSRISKASRARIRILGIQHGAYRYLVRMPLRNPLR